MSNKELQDLKDRTAVDLKQTARLPSDGMVRATKHYEALGTLLVAFKEIDRLKAKLAAVRDALEA